MQAAIAKVETKRQELAVTQAAGTTTKILTMLPRAAEAFRTAITEGLDGKHPEAAARARLTDGRGEAICRVHAEVCSYSFVRTTHWKPLREALQRCGHAVKPSHTNTRRARRDE